MKRLVVIGNGMAGVACVEEILRYGSTFHITVFGEESCASYNRSLLSSVLSGERSIDEIELNGFDWYGTNGITLRLGVQIVEIDVSARTVTGDDGSVTGYDKLLIATGSSPFVPPIPGVDKNGVFTFRNLENTRALLERAGRGVRAVVVGGGFLGVEAACGLHVRGCDVTMIHSAGTLMERHLDGWGGSYLREKMETMGIRVLLPNAAQAIHGDAKVESVEVRSGEAVDADIVVIAAGIRPNAELARRAGLKVSQGIVVNDWLETSNPDIFACGECAEHNGLCYGPVAPLREQASVLAAAITGHQGPLYAGSLQQAQLKVVGIEVFSAGFFDDSSRQLEVVRYEDPSMGIYKKLTLKGNRLAGVILVGDTGDSHRYMEWLRQGTDLAPFRRQLLAAAPVDAAQDAVALSGCGDGGDS